MIFCVYFFCLFFLFHCESSPASSPVNPVKELYNITQCAEDLLKNQGFFLPQSFEKWKLNSSHLETHLSIYNGSNYYLSLKKSHEAELSFEDGLLINFEPKKVKHVRFFFAPSEVDRENTNLRIKSSSNKKTLISFRCGNAGFIRVNDHQMVDFFNFTVSNTTHHIWTKADIFINWQDELIKIYINETYKGEAGFYHEEIEEVDTLMLYNLKPSTTSYWRNLQVCEEFCEGFNWSDKKHVLLLVIFTLAIIMILF